MTRTFNRQPLSVNTPNKDNIKDYFFNHYNWKGLNDDKNFLTIDQETFSDCDNVYIDKEGLLRSRPSLKYNRGLDIKKIWELSGIEIILKENNLTFTNTQTSSKLIVTENVWQDIVPVLVDEKIFIFSSSGIAYYDILTNKYVITNDVIYSPINTMYINNILSENKDDNNILTNKHKIQYNYNGANYNFSNFINKTVDVKISNSNYNINNFNENTPLTFVDKFTNSDTKIYDDYGRYTNLPISISENGVILKYNTSTGIISYSSDGKIYNTLPPLNNLKLAKISRDGYYAFGITDTTIYVYSLFKTTDSGYKYTYWQDLFKCQSNYSEWYNSLPWTSKAFNFLENVNSCEFQSDDNFVINVSCLLNKSLIITYGGETVNDYHLSFLYICEAGKLSTKVISDPVGYIDNSFKTSLNKVNENEYNIKITASNTINLHKQYLPYSNTENIVKIKVTDVTYNELDSNKYSRITVKYTIDGTEDEKTAITENINFALVNNKYDKYVRYGAYGSLRSSKIAIFAIAKYNLSNDTIDINLNFVMVNDNTFCFSGKPTLVDNNNSIYALSNSVDYSSISSEFLKNLKSNGSYEVSSNIALLSLWSVYYVDNGGLSNKYYLQSIQYFRLSIYNLLYLSQNNIQGNNLIRKPSLNDILVFNDIVTFSYMSNDNYVNIIQYKYIKNENGDETLNTVNKKLDIINDTMQVLSLNGHNVYITLNSFEFVKLTLSKSNNYLLTNNKLYPYTVYDNDTSKYTGIDLLHKNVVPIEYYYAGNSMDSIYYIKDNILYSSSAIKNITITETIDGEFNYVVPSYIAELDEYYFAIGKTLYISSKRYDKDGNYQWYFPENNKITFDYEITNLHPISDKEIAVFLQNSIYYVTYDSDNKLYRAYKTRAQVGCLKGCDVITTFDSKYTLFNSERGIVTMSYQEFISSQEQSLSYITDTIYSVYKNYSSENIKLYKYSYWIIVYKLNSNKGFVYDTRNGSWWPMSISTYITNILTIDNKINILSEGKIFNLNTSDTNYIDYGNKIISWFIKSQKLYLNAINYYKHIANITFMSVHDLKYLQDNDYNINELDCKLQINNYRKKIDGNIDTNDGEVLNYKVENIRTFVQRLNFSKVNEFEYKLSNIDNVISVPLSLSGITIKYMIGDKIR